MDTNATPEFPRADAADYLAATRMVHAHDMTNLYGSPRVMLSFLSWDNQKSRVIATKTITTVDTLDQVSAVLCDMLGYAVFSETELANSVVRIFCAE